MKIRILKRENKWHIQLIGNNNEIVYWTENYNDKRDALRAIELLKEIDFDSIVVNEE